MAPIDNQQPKLTKGERKRRRFEEQQALKSVTQKQHECVCGHSHSVDKDDSGIIQTNKKNSTFVMPVKMELNPRAHTAAAVLLTPAAETLNPFANIPGTGGGQILSKEVGNGAKNTIVKGFCASMGQIPAQSTQLVPASKYYQAPAPAAAAASLPVSKAVAAKKTTVARLDASSLLVRQQVEFLQTHSVVDLLNLVSRSITVCEHEQLHNHSP